MGYHKYKYKSGRYYRGRTRGGRYYTKRSASGCLIPIIQTLIIVLLIVSLIF